MSREILFRGKRTDNGEWVEGYYTFYINGFSELGKEEHVIRDTRENAVKTYFIDPKTVCQYTGLTDKNSRKIFDRDIIQFEKKKYFVVWLDSIASFVAKPFEEGRCWPCMNVGTMKEAEVIGNIFDNPELKD